jgi:hypothetical protein
MASIDLKQPDWQEDMYTLASDRLSTQTLVGSNLSQLYAAKPSRVIGKTVTEKACKLVTDIAYRPLWMTNLSCICHLVHNQGCPVVM